MKNVNKVKIVKEKKDLYIEFSEDEIKEMGWKENQKLSLDVVDGAIHIKPWVSVDIDTSTWPIEMYQFLVEESLIKNKTINDVIVDLLSDMLNKNNKTTKEQLICE